ncbi:hypothetical protein SDRG_01608 [Saprolegnia diclina VS20]|uniref:UDENN domain-containing protein n=1 Tax=Saprolegnia diclina (strain VS20) TaxID=1156394 RepID=T0R5H6_SAPDV|nr:hypothetical protein SDRG_01608 [Saprolegnia diclina VS20]EQC41650.1 hypothetical protein SDRG_01608 [Saprolegnia diclina VS20]|eukprot:XP_008605364.1 hypothetical protein SDRG_01608 [Saprolegnia diclina VS20]
MEVNRWGVVAIASVVFDIDVGQTLEAMYPQTASLTTSAQKSIAYLALPHSNRHDEGDTQFAFRCRSEDESTSSFLYGFVLFRQRKDAAKTRGYFQKAIVIVTQTPFVGLYERVLRVVGPLYFQVGNPLLEALYDNVLQWPAPMPDTTMILPVAGTFVSFVVPAMVPSIEAPAPTRRWSIEQESFDVNADDMASHDEDDDEAPDEQAIVRNGKFTAPAPRVAPSPLFCDILNAQDAGISFESVGLFSSFEGLEACLWDLWQLAITGESVLMAAPSARVCSQAVLAFTSLIAPVAYHGDYRPYFALYEADFTSIAAVHDTTKCVNFPTTVLGTTNPFFLKALRFWPNAVVFPFLDASSRPATPPTAKRAFGFLDTDAANVDDTSRPRRYIKRAAELDSFPESYAPRLLARSSRLVQPDPVVLRQLVEATAVETSEGLQNGDEPPSVSINNAVLRKHFKHLTEVFLKPFEPYFGIWSNHLHVAPSPYMDVTVFMKPFVATEFLKSLATIPSTKLPTPLRTSRKKLRALYARFIASPHFLPWFAARRHECIDAFDSVLRTLRETIDAKALLTEPSGAAMDLHMCQQLKTQIQRTIELAASQATPDARHIALMETHLHDVSAAILALSAATSDD